MATWPTPRPVDDWVDTKAPATAVFSDDWKDTKPAEEKKSSLADDVAQFVFDASRGGGAGVAKSVVMGGDLIRRIAGMERILERPEVKELITAPDTAGGKVGEFIEGAAEFMVPGTAVARATKGAVALARGLAQGATAAGVAGVQSGGDPAAMGAAGAVAGAIPLAAPIGKKVVQMAASPAAREAIGVISPRAKNALELADRARRAVQGLSGGGTLRDIAPKPSAPRLAEAVPPVKQPWMPPRNAETGRFVKASPEKDLPFKTQVEPNVPRGTGGGTLRDIGPMADPKARKAAEELAEALGASASPELKATLPGSVFEDIGRGEKALGIANYLKRAGIKTADLSPLPLDDPFWKIAAQKAGENAPSPASVTRILAELKKLERAAK